MESTNTIENHLEALSPLFDLSATSGQAYEGEIEGDVQVLVSILETDPPALMVRFPINRSRFPFGLSHVPKSAQPTIASGKLNYEAKEYSCTISAYDLSETTPEEFAAIIRESVELLNGLGLFEPKPCTRCGKAFDSAAEYFGNNRTCPDCARRRREIRQKAEAELNKPKPAMAILIPIVMVLSAAGWLGFWAGFDAIFVAADSDTIAMPTLLIIAILFGVGFLLGNPLGRLIRRTGLLEKFSAERTVFLLVGLSLIAGEIIYVIILLKKAHVLVSFSTIWQVLNSYGLFFAFEKLVVAGAVYFSALSASDRKKLPS